MYSVLIHYAELALKGRNRPWFLHSLVRHLRTALKDLDLVHVKPLMGRIEARFRDGADWDDVRARLRVMPGIGNFSRATHLAPDVEALAAAIVEAVRGRPAASFRIAARRADKRFGPPSPEIERIIGRRVQEATGWPVNLSAPEFVIRVEIVTDDAFFYFEKEKGPGGLPIGTSGRVLCLLSGGIDSPVAAWKMIRRGCRTHFVHFHSAPILSRTSQDKARALVEQLTRRELRARLWLVPFAPVQQQVVITVPPALRVVVYRRLMLRIAERIAGDIGAHGLVTGDVLGQVASQTLENLAVVGEVATLPVLRPLVGFDKEEITLEAQALGTYDISIVPDEDCCTLFTPKFPTTRASRRDVIAAEAGLDIVGLVEAAVAGAVVEDFRWPPKPVAHASGG